jgi:hypothetical protein
LLAYTTFIISANVFYRNEGKYIRYFLIGSALAALYSWYLFFSALFGLPQFLLWGIEEPQIIGVSFGVFIRSGTFKEGNYMGMFLLLSAVLSFYSNRKLLGYFFVATMITTFSSIGFVCVVFFMVCYYFKMYYQPRHFHKLMLAFIILGASFLALLGNENFKMLVISKFAINNDDISNSGDFSKVDRLNTAMVGIRMGIDNPVIGVGLSNYALHHDYFNENPMFDNYPVKRIPNNVYVELFSETGVIGLLLFLILLYYLYKRTALDNTGVLRYGLVAVAIYLNAFPTFTILYLWVFFGLIASLHTNNNNG